jgi:hypothetical protein
LTAPGQRRSRLRRPVWSLIPLLLAQGPALALANRIEPRLFGMPFLYGWLLLLYLVAIALLIFAAWPDRTDSST